MGKTAPKHTRPKPTPENKSSLPKIFQTTTLRREELSKNDKRHRTRHQERKIKKRTAFPPSRRETLPTDQHRYHKTKVRARTFMQATDLTRREFSRDISGNDKPNNKAKTKEKQHQNKHYRHRNPKTKVRSRKFFQTTTLRKEER